MRNTAVLGALIIIASVFLWGFNELKLAKSCRAESVFGGYCSITCETGTPRCVGGLFRARCMCEEGFGSVAVYISEQRSNDLLEFSSFALNELHSSTGKQMGSLVPLYVEAANRSDYENFLQYGDQLDKLFILLTDAEKNKVLQFFKNKGYNVNGF